MNLNSELDLTEAKNRVEEEIHNPASLTKEKYNSLFNILRGFEEFTLNAEGFIISSNLEAVNITGYEEWEIMGKHFSLFYLQQDKIDGKPKDDLFQALHSNRIVSNGWKLKKRNMEFWASMRIEVLKSNTGQTVGFRVILKDATHKAMHRYRIDKIRQDYLNLFENTYTGIFRFQFSTGKVLLMNSKALEMFGKSETDEFRFSQLFYGKEEYNQFIETLNNRKKTSGFEFSFNDQKLRQNWASITCRYYSKEDCVEGILLDVTEQRRRIIQLKHLTNELDKFIYRASHDLRSPLTSLLGLASLIIAESPCESISNYAGMINERVHHLDNLLKEIVFISSNNTMPLAIGKISFKKEIEMILDSVINNLSEISVTVNVDDRVGSYNDIVRIRAILTHLISNAIKFANKSVINKLIVISITSGKELISIKISDNGIGIDSLIQEKIFEMFFKGTDSAPGFGLGLYIVKCMVSKLDGHITFTSQIGRGSEFQVQLPNYIGHHEAIL
jgi:signal transduction histidine kinase